MARPQTLRLLATALLVAALIAIGWGLATGQLRFALALVVPVVYGSGPWALAAFALLSAALAAWWAASVRGGSPPTDPAAIPPAEATRERGASGGGVVLIGPIPIVFGSNQRIAFLMALIGLAMIAGLVALTWWTTF